MHIGVTQPTITVALTAELYEDERDLRGVIQVQELTEALVMTNEILKQVYKYMLCILEGVKEMCSVVQRNSNVKRTK